MGHSDSDGVARLRAGRWGDQHFHAISQFFFTHAAGGFRDHYDWCFIGAAGAGAFARCGGINGKAGFRAWCRGVTGTVSHSGCDGVIAFARQFAARATQIFRRQGHRHSGAVSPAARDSGRHFIGGAVRLGHSDSDGVARLRACRWGDQHFHAVSQLFFTHAAGGFRDHHGWCFIGAAGAGAFARCGGINGKAGFFAWYRGIASSIRYGCSDGVIAFFRQFTARATQIFRRQSDRHSSAVSPATRDSGRYFIGGAIRLGHGDSDGVTRLSACWWGDQHFHTISQFFFTHTAGGFWDHHGWCFIGAAGAGAFARCGGIYIETGFFAWH
ncbi:hypothetical protein D515_04023 [Grimontia indica]|uniref:Uncharacterized protein n=1 Tax=Grimontia indica TaxID=1056512 RepID=R1I985_9GAMM|nr:hypothetical protein D515_04023 [Grimontia indica]